ncbi:MAG: hypothetical protein DRO05_00860 [Thermoproteota archaeon]|nr:MAG: hypothetical protein DRO05_00860 [Candidatus Korarchaeota archaeon]
MNTKNEEEKYRFTPKGLVLALLLEAGLDTNEAEEITDRIFERLEWECIRVGIERDKQWTDKDLPAIIKDGDWDFQKVRKVEEGEDK